MPGAGTGSTGCSQNEDVPASEGVTTVSAAAGSVVVVSEAVAGGSGLPRPRSPTCGAGRLRRGKARGGRTPGAGRGHPVGCDDCPPDGSKNAGLSRQGDGVCR